jgi:hypothetical protein
MSEGATAAPRVSATAATAVASTERSILFFMTGFVLT